MTNAFDRVRANLSDAKINNEILQADRVHKYAGWLLVGASVFFAGIYIFERYILHGAEESCKKAIDLNCVLGTMHSATSIQWAETVLAGIVGGAVAMYFGKNGSH